MTATITEGAVDTDWTILLDFDEEIPCDSKRHKEPVMAVWKIILSCCGRVAYLCQECFDANLEVFADPEVIGMLCDYCKVTHCPPSKIIASAEKIRA